MSGSAAASPCAVLITMGKKHTSVTTRTRGRRPKPNHTTSSGARAMMGIVCETTRSG